jgi:Methyltransferase domain
MPICLSESDIARLIAGSPSRFDLWLRLLHSSPMECAAEIGVWKGDFAKVILSNFSNLTKYYMIDPWAHLPDWNKPFNVDDRTFEDVYAEALLKTDFASSRRIVLRGRTNAVIDEIPDQSLDFAYIDGDHTLRGITIDLTQVLPKIKDGGLIGGDDFVNKPWQHGRAHEPTLVYPFAVYFAEAMRLPFVALPHKQFLIQKAADAGFSFVDVVGTYSDLSLKSLSQS